MTLSAVLPPFPRIKVFPTSGFRFRWQVARGSQAKNVRNPSSKLAKSRAKFLSEEYEIPNPMIKLNRGRPDPAVDAL